MIKRMESKNCTCHISDFTSFFFAFYEKHGLGKQETWLRRKRENKLKKKNIKNIGE